MMISKHRGHQAGSSSLCNASLPTQKLVYLVVKRRDALAGANEPSFEVEVVGHPHLLSRNGRPQNLLRTSTPKRIILRKGTRLLMTHLSMVGET